MQSGSITLIAEGVLTPPNNSSLQSLVPGLPEPLRSLSNATVTEAFNPRPLDQCVVQACFPDMGADGRLASLPLAAFSCAADESIDAARNHYWLRCDPVVIAAGGRGLSLSDIASQQLTPQQIQSLANTVAEVLSDYDLTLVTTALDRWYLRLERAPDVVFSPVWVAERDGVDACMPRGPDAAIWIERMSACQIALHANPINEQRESEGITPISSIWFWGSTSVTDVSAVGAPYFECIYGDQPMARGIALHANRGIDMLPEHPITQKILIACKDGVSDHIQQLILRVEQSWLADELLTVTVIDPRVGQVSFAATSDSFSRRTVAIWTNLRKRWLQS